MRWLEQCCCCEGCLCSLKAGTIAISIISMIFSIAVMTFHLVFPLGGKGWAYSQAGYCLAMLAASIILIIGALMEMKWLLMPYLITGLVGYVFALAGTILVAVKTSDVIAISLYVTFLLTPASLLTYFLIVVYSFFLQLKDRQQVISTS